MMTYRTRLNHLSQAVRGGGAGKVSQAKPSQRTARTQSPKALKLAPFRPSGCLLRRLAPLGLGRKTSKLQQRGGWPRWQSAARGFGGLPNVQGLLGARGTGGTSSQSCSNLLVHLLHNGTSQASTRPPCLRHCHGGQGLCHRPPSRTHLALPLPWLACTQTICCFGGVLVKCNDNAAHTILAKSLESRRPR